MEIQDDRGYNQVFKPSKTNLKRAERRNRYFEERIDNAAPRNILEIGCGLGDLSGYLALHSKHNVFGTDLCLPFIEEARQKYTLPNLQFETLDFNHPEKIGNQKFDYIIGNGILHHLYSDLDTALVNMKKLLSKNGKILFLEPNLLNPYCYLIFSTTPFFRNWAKLEPTEKAFTKTFIHKKLLRCGYQNITIEYKDFLVPGIPFWLVKPVVFTGNILEKLPLVKCISQSIFIYAEI